jgi:hypothetical protein
MEKWIRLSTWFSRKIGYKFLILLAIVSLTGCGQALAQQPTAIPTVVATSTISPTATQLPSHTPTLAPTSTPEPTSTPVPPTATLLPPLAVLADGLNIWCAPLDYAGTTAQGPDEPGYARKMVNNGDMLQASIPAAYCAVVAHFNQPAPNGLLLKLFDGTNEFLKQSLAVADAQPDVAWTSINHSYVVNPPLWWVDYRRAIVDASGKEVWSNPVRFEKPLPETCVYGGLPDPVTLYCAVTDPWEIEPHPDATYPYDRTRLTPDP